MTKGTKTKPIPDYGDLMTLREFIACCLIGGFIDYDGDGNYATATEMFDKGIKPSDVTNGTYDRDPTYTHVVWFNR